MWEGPRRYPLCGNSAERDDHLFIFSLTPLGCGVGNLRSLEFNLYWESFLLKEDFIPSHKLMHIRIIMLLFLYYIGVYGFSEISQYLRIFLLVGD